MWIASSDGWKNNWNCRLPTDILPITYAHVKWFFLFISQESPPNVASLSFAMELECDLGAIQNEELLRKMVSESHSQSYVSISLLVCMYVGGTWGWSNWDLNGISIGDPGEAFVFY